MPEMSEAYSNLAVIVTAAIIGLSLLAFYCYSLLSAPKSIFQKPTRHVEIKSFRKH